jgi:peptide chain release factor 1
MDCTIEIRPAAGGDEAKIWAKDLLRMYLRFAEKKGWKTSSIETLSLKISGEEAFQRLKSESGVHRVQRVPTTESHGRIHTSTATVAVLPIIADQAVDINNNDLQWQFYRASSQGGQNVNKVSSAVRLIHKPSGITVESQTQRSQQQNRKIALDLLKARLWENKMSKKKEKIDKQRKKAVGQGERSEKIRTYNYPRNQVNDHRLGKKYRLEDIINGDLEKLTKTLLRSLA